MRRRLDHHEEKRHTMRILARLALCVVIVLVSTAQADDLGRLFFSKAERKQLDQHLSLRVAGKDGQNEQPHYLVVNGVIQHSDGSRTAWINGKAQHNAPGKNPSTVPVTAPGKTEAIEVKVGQRLNIDNIPPPLSEAPPTSK
jgi:hypothetical protein